jgi:hypothetical protein
VFWTTNVPYAARQCFPVEAKLRNSNPTNSGSTSSGCSHALISFWSLRIKREPLRCQSRVVDTRSSAIRRGPGWDEARQRAQPRRSLQPQQAADVLRRQDRLEPQQEIVAPGAKLLPVLGVQRVRAPAVHQVAAQVALAIGSPAGVRPREGGDAQAGAHPVEHVVELALARPYVGAARSISRAHSVAGGCGKGAVAVQPRPLSIIPPGRTAPRRALRFCGWSAGGPSQTAQIRHRLRRSRRASGRRPPRRSPSPGAPASASRRWRAPRRPPSVRRAPPSAARAPRSRRRGRGWVRQAH